MKILLPLLFCTACAVLLLSQHRPERTIASGPPSPALLDAMSSHGIEVGTAAAPAADADTTDNASALRPAVFTTPMPGPALQPVSYTPN